MTMLPHQQRRDFFKNYESLSNELLSPSFSLLLSLYLAVLVEFICRLCSLLRCLYASVSVPVNRDLAQSQRPNWGY